MCGVFGYTGQSTANDLVFQGLKRLEYRGYDSWGIAVNDNKGIKIYKNVGDIKVSEKFKELPETNIAIGHTRWATHGGVCIRNAHPHLSTDKSFTLVQNGIVENYTTLKKKLLKKGYPFKSETDTEVIVRLIEDELRNSKDLNDAVKKAFKKLEGRNTIVILTNKNKRILAVKNGSPLVVGIGEDGTYLASDSLSFSPYTNKIITLDNFDFLEIQGKDIHLENIKTGKKELKIKSIKNSSSKIDKGKYEHYMMKEIVDQKDTVVSATQYTKKQLRPLLQAIKKAHRVYVVGAGTAGFAAGQICYFLRNIASIDAQDIRSYEFNSYINIIKKEDLILAISQSGETADTIEVLEIAKEKGCKVASIVNMLGTTISKMSDYPYFANAGPEICVASTKVFTAQCSWGYLISKTLINKEKEAKENIKKLSRKLDSYFKQKTYKEILRLSKKIKDSNHLFVLGKGQNTYIALEGALKIKEISYKHIEGFMAGELKHGVIALIEKGTPVFSIISDDQDSKDIISATEQVRTRGAFTIGIGDKKFKKYNIWDMFLATPQVEDLASLSNVIAFQLISYYLSKELGNNIDKPRNLAKSVTVK